MKKIVSSVRGIAWASVFVLGLGLVLTSCLKNHDDTIDNNNNAAGLMAFNLAPGQTAVGFSIGGNSLTQTALGFNSFTGNYLAVYPGARVIDAYDFGTGDSLASASGSFELGKYYSVFLVGGTDSTLENVIVRDNVDSLSSSTQAFVRYINAIPDASSSTVTVSSGGSNVVNEATSFKSVSQFVAVNPGDVAVTVSNGGTINANRTISLEAKKVYTILLIGQPGGTGDNAVQVKFITNGVVDDSTANRISSAAVNRAIN